MKTKHAFAVLSTVVALSLAASSAHGQYPTAESETVQKATSVLNEFMTMPSQGIPQSMIQKAEGLVIVPGMIKVGFVVGGRRGKGIAVVRDENGAWRPPTFVTMTGGSVGFQAGVQSTDVILVFNTRKSVENLLSGKFTIGVDAAAAAGPVGRQAAAATDGRLQAEIYSYSRSRGLFAGASVDGSVIQMDAAETQNFYRATGMTPDGTPIAPNAQLPLAAAQFLAALGAYSGTAVAAPGVAGPVGANLVGAAVADGITAPQNMAAGGSVLPPGNAIMPAEPAAGVFPPGSTPTNGSNAGVPQQPAPVSAVQAMETTRAELAKSAQNLGALLDESWRQYLSLPQGVFSGAATPSAESLRQSLQRFDAVAKETKYNLLLQRKEFQQTYGLLRTYLEQVETAAAPQATAPSANASPGSGARATIR